MCGWSATWRSSSCPRFRGRSRSPREVRTRGPGRGGLSHPNILAIHDFGHQDGQTYATFELLEGSTLRERLSKGPLPPRKAAAIAAQVACGLDAAHSRGIVHRDIKPENLFITASGLVKILDFGIAALAEQWSRDDTKTVNVLTGQGVTLGTASYMAPEQVRGETTTAAADLFALGVMLHELISGIRPFDRVSPAATMAAVLHEDAPALPVNMPAALTRIVERLLEKAPEDRFRSAHDLLRPRGVKFRHQFWSGDEDPAAGSGMASRHSRCRNTDSNRRMVARSHRCAGRVRDIRTADISPRDGVSGAFRSARDNSLLGRMGWPTG